MEVPGKSPLILIVDEDARAASLLARMLAEDGFLTEVTIDGAAALSRLTRGPIPDALVTDYYLPLADGLAVARYARSRLASMPVVIMTGDAPSLGRASALAPLEGSLLVITKPMEYRELVSHLRGQLRMDVPRDGS